MVLPEWCDTLLEIVTDKGIMKFLHEQECCESVHLDDGLDELHSMIGEVILFSEKVDFDKLPNEDPYNSESYSWTFYKISTINHDCTLRFYGESNGNYSESVDIIFIENQS